MFVEKCAGPVGMTVSLGRAPMTFLIIAITSLGTSDVQETRRRKSFKPLYALVAGILVSLWMIISHTLSFIAYNTEARFRNCMAAFMSMGSGMVVITKYTLYLTDSLSGCCNNCCKS